MRYLLLITTLLGPLWAKAQNTPPAEFAFQAVVRQANGRLLKNTNVTLVASVRPSQSAADLWRETLSRQTDAFGVVSATIGSGVNAIGAPAPASFSALNFGSGSYWLKVQLGSTSGPVLTDQKLLAVPYANYARYAGNVNPPGSVIAFAGDTTQIPVGWLLCNGKTLNANSNDPVSGLSYAALYTAIGTNWGGSNAASFKLPDLRGQFLRGWSNDAKKDPDFATRQINPDSGSTVIGGRVGSYQRHAFKDLFTAPDPLGGVLQATYYSTRHGQMSPGNYDEGAYPTGSALPGVSFKFIRPAPIMFKPYVSTETRPNNAYVHYIIKL